MALATGIFWIIGGIAYIFYKLFREEEAFPGYFFGVVKLMAPVFIGAILIGIAQQLDNMATSIVVILVSITVLIWFLVRIITWEINGYNSRQSMQRWAQGIDDMVSQIPVDHDAVMEIMRKKYRGHIGGSSESAYLKKAEEQWRQEVRCGLHPEVFSISDASEKLKERGISYDPLDKH